MDRTDIRNLNLPHRSLINAPILRTTQFSYHSAGLLNSIPDTYKHLSNIIFKDNIIKAWEELLYLQIISSYPLLY